MKLSCISERISSITRNDIDTTRIDTTRVDTTRNDINIQSDRRVSLGWE